MAATPVHVKVEFDYDRLAEAITKSIRPQTITVTVQPDEDAAAAIQRAVADLSWRQE